MPLTRKIDDFQLYKGKRAYLEFNKIMSISEIAAILYTKYISTCGAEIKHIPEQLRREPENDNV